MKKKQNESSKGYLELRNLCDSSESKKQIIRLIYGKVKPNYSDIFGKIVRQEKNLSDLDMNRIYEYCVSSLNYKGTIKKLFSIKDLPQKEKIKFGKYYNEILNERFRIACDKRMSYFQEESLTLSDLSRLIDGISEDSIRNYYYGINRVNYIELISKSLNIAPSFFNGLTAIPFDYEFDTYIKESQNHFDIYKNKRIVLETLKNTIRDCYKECINKSNYPYDDISNFDDYLLNCNLATDIIPNIYDEIMEKYFNQNKLKYSKTKVNFKNDMISYLNIIDFADIDIKGLKFELNRYCLEKWLLLNHTQYYDKYVRSLDDISKEERLKKIDSIITTLETDKTNYFEKKGGKKNDK